MTRGQRKDRPNATNIGNGQGNHTTSILYNTLRAKSSLIFRILSGACLTATFLATAASESGYNFTACMAVVFASLGGAALFGWLAERGVASERSGR